MKKVFGESWWVIPSENGKFALIQTEINVGDKCLEDLTNKQRKGATVEIFDTEEIANKERIQRVMSSINLPNDEKNR